MLRKIAYLILALLFLGQYSCDSPTKNDEENSKQTVTLSGRVVNENTQSPVGGVVVRVADITPEATGITDENGSYSLEIETDHSFEVSLIAYKESFISDTLSVMAVPGRMVDVPLLKLQPTAGTPVSSGEAASIILAGVSSASIGVKESGSPETAEIVFEVQDSTGTPVDLDHSVKVDFSLGSRPDGGEFIFPTSAVTSSNGRVMLNLFSGITAGVVQIIATANLESRTIISKPVAIAIHGGLPDSVHFSLAVEKLNFPGYNIYGLTDAITAFVGDKYGNPVRPNTSVYFTTSGGIIEGSSETNEFGQATVDLISSSPKPNHPTLGPGFATVTGRTADENQNTIEAYATVLFSGVTQLQVSPTNISVPNGGSQFFTYTVQDQNGNPLAEGTDITVAVESGQVKAIGDVGVTLPDTQSKYWTDFSFSLVDAVPDTALANPVSVKIRTIGPNGAAQVTITGSAQ